MAHGTACSVGHSVGLISAPEVRPLSGMSSQLPTLASLVGMVVVLILAMELGRRVGYVRRQTDPEGAEKGLSAVEGAVFGLMGLLVAFTFSGAIGRFDLRRELIVKEANAIGTAWLRLDLLPAAPRETVRAEMRRYLEARIVDSVAGESEANPAVTASQQKIWRETVSASASIPPNTAAFVLGALNEMFDVAGERYAAARYHASPAVFVLLLVLAFLSSLLAGYGMAGAKERCWLHISCFIAALLISIFVIVDTEFPRRGLVHLDRYDVTFTSLRESLK